MLSAVSRRSPLTAVVLAAAVVLPRLILIPQRGRIDDPRDGLVECLGYTLGRLGGRLDE
jgi:hypothetical protein